MAEVGGAQLYFRARTPHRAVFAGASALFLVALSGWSNSDLSTEHTKLPLAGGALGRRGLQDAGAAHPSCDSGLADALRQDHCEIPGTPSTCTLPQDYASFQCLYVDQASRLRDDENMPGGAVAAAARATFANDDGTPFATVSFRQLAADNATQLNVWIDPAGPKHSGTQAVNFTQLQVHSNSIVGSSREACIGAGKRYSMRFTTAVQVKVPIGSDRLCLRGGAHHNDKGEAKELIEWQCKQRESQASFFLNSSRCDGQGWPGVGGAAGQLPGFGQCWRRYADYMYGELSIPLLAER
jgi:hypothetical protein